MNSLKKSVKGMVLIAWAAAFWLAAGCGGGGISTVGNPVDGTLYDALVRVAPSFSPSTNSSLNAQAEKAASGAKAVSEEWGSGNPVYEIFYLFREFNSATDQGVIDTSNLYKTMWESRSFMGRIGAECQSISEQVIAPPFDFGNGDVTYNCAMNDIDPPDGYDLGGALKQLDEDGNIIAPADYETATVGAQFGTVGFVWVDDAVSSAHYEYGSLEGGYNLLSDDLSVDIAVWVDYTAENDYCYRNDIDGNANTHAFTMRSVKGNTVEGSSFLSVVGKGVSEGEGEYFLLKVTTNDLDGKYFCIAATDGEAELQLLDPEGSETVDDNCAVYAADVDALVAFTTDNLLCSSTDLNPGGTGTASEGTVYLGFVE